MTDVLKKHAAAVQMLMNKKDKECELLKIEDGVRGTVHVYVNRATKQVAVMYKGAVQVIDYVLDALISGIEWLRNALSKAFTKLGVVLAV